MPDFGAAKRLEWFFHLTGVYPWNPWDESPYRRIWEGSEWDATPSVTTWVTTHLARVSLQ